MQGMQLESMDNSDSRLTVKQLESKKKQLKTKLSNLLDAPKRDDVVTFEELGADSLMVDEAHNFKNLMTVTTSRVSAPPRAKRPVTCL